MGKKKNKFTEQWVNLTNLGKEFGLSSVAIGKKLKELNLRKENGEPTEMAITNGFCRFTPLRDGTPFFMWNKQKIIYLMQQSGYIQLDHNEKKAQELADEWIKINKLYQDVTSSIEEKLLFERGQQIIEEGHKAGLIPRINQILASRKLQKYQIEDHVMQNQN